MTFQEILDYSFWGNSVQDYIIALAVFAVAVIVFRIIKYGVLKKLRSITERSSTEIDDLLVKVVDRVRWPFYVFFAASIALNFIQVHNLVNVFFTYATPIVVVFIIAQSLQQFVDYGMQKLAKDKKQENEESVIKVLGRIFKGALWALALVYIISLFGVDVTTVVASIGVIGIVLGFGLQHILGDIFASFSIFFDKPFEVGDFIIVGDNLGVVKNVGIRSTRIQSLWGHEVVISNQELTSTRINNYKKLERRRVQFNFGVVYDTPSEKLEKILKITEEVVDKIELAELDRVHFKKYGDYSLEFEVVYYIDSPDYNTYMDIQQEINFALKKRFEKEEINFAYPTQTVIVNENK
ncbi:MAG TPA: mechanosensitive ion channel family protein [Candidatus Bathyarchaeota archaeon]|nr:mechanosensitive ion channel family protein [Candidatus Bathyarchaeota archaeon]